MRSLLAVVLLACTPAGSLLPGRATLLRPRCLGPSCGVRALAKAKSKRQGKGKAPSGAKVSPKGFGAPPPPPPPPPPARAAAPSGTGGGGSPQLVAVDLGRGKQVSVMLPPQAQEPTEAELRRLETSADAVAQQGVLGAYKHLYGAGDVVWPASVALARLLAHVPSFSAVTARSRGKVSPRWRLSSPPWPPRAGSPRLLPAAPRTRHSPRSRSAPNGSRQLCRREPRPKSSPSDLHLTCTCTCTCTCT